MQGTSRDHEASSTLADWDLPEPCFKHIHRLTTPLGIWEHTEYGEPRRHHGFCTDDNARALIVVLREDNALDDLTDLMRNYMGFIEAAALRGGGFHNRRRESGAWVDTIGSDDSQGRAIWALGTWFRRAGGPSMRRRAADLFDRQTAFVSTSPRANSFAVLGASEVLKSDPSYGPAMNAIGGWASHLHSAHNPEWPWPEERLAYQNARIPEAMIAAGSVMADDPMVEEGLRLLKWLLSVEMPFGHFSFTPVGGWTVGEPRPAFDQQPTEAGAIADACARAWSVTGDRFWLDGVIKAGEWLVGNNDAHAVLYDSLTGACSDGLMVSGPNLNRGAESTLAALSVLQQVRRVNWAC